MSLMIITSHRLAGTLLGPLDGAPIGIKDNFCTTRLETTCGSRVLEGFTSPYEATVVKHLNKAGAIIMGKTNMDEFGMGAANIFSHYGAVINPHDKNVSSPLGKRRVAGGSSGGSAAAVASGMCVAALGSDTGGSVRLPASYCGVVGYKPSYGRCSRYGLVSYANSLDTVGILAKDVGYASRVYDAISIYDEKDPTCMPDKFRARVDEQDQALAGRWATDDLSGLVVGIPQEYYVDPISNTVIDIWRTGIQHLRERGATIVPISLPHTRFALSAYFTIALGEASSNLARFDGVEYGRRSKVQSDSEDNFLYADTRAEGFGSEVKRRIMLGTHILTAGTYEKNFLPAQKARRLIQQDFDDAFSLANPLHNSSQQATSGVHVILVPSATSEPPRIEDCVPESDQQENDGIDKQNSAVETYVNDVLTIPASLAGLPAISVPVGKGQDGFPVGLQLLGQYGYDRFILRMADILSRAEQDQ